MAGTIWPALWTKQKHSLRWWASSSLTSAAIPKYVQTVIIRLVQACAMAGMIRSALQDVYNRTYVRVYMRRTYVPLHVWTYVRLYVNFSYVRTFSCMKTRFLQSGIHGLCYISAAAHECVIMYSTYYSAHRPPWIDVASWWQSSRPISHSARMWKNAHHRYVCTSASGIQLCIIMMVSSRCNDHFRLVSNLWRLIFNDGVQAGQVWYCNYQQNDRSICTEILFKIIVKANQSAAEPLDTESPPNRTIELRTLKAEIMVAPIHWAIWQGFKAILKAPHLTHHKHQHTW